MSEIAFPPHIMLEVDLKNAGIELVRAEAKMEACRHRDDSRGFESYLRDVEQTIEGIRISFANYKIAIAAGREKLTRAEYNAPAIPTEPAVAAE